MAAWRRAIELSLTDADTAKLTSVAQSRSDRRSFFAVGQALGLHHQTVQRCVERAAGVAAAPEDGDAIVLAAYPLAGRPSVVP